VRLGLQKFNQQYIPSLLKCLEFPQSLGFIGGRPRASLYFIGHQDDRVFYMDPHTVQPSSGLDDDIDVYSVSYHTSDVYSMRIHDIDPSLALGFYCRSYHDFCDFWERVKKMVSESKFPVFQTADVTPSYVFDDITGSDSEDEKKSTRKNSDSSPSSSPSDSSYLSSSSSTFSSTSSSYTSSSSTSLTSSLLSSSIAAATQLASVVSAAAKAAVRQTSSSPSSSPQKRSRFPTSNSSNNFTSSKNDTNSNGVSDKKDNDLVENLNSLDLNENNVTQNNLNGPKKSRSSNSDHNNNYNSSSSSSSSSSNSSSSTSSTSSSTSSSRSQVDRNNDMGPNIYSIEDDAALAARIAEEDDENDDFVFV